MFIAFPLTNRAARACSLRNLEDGLSEASVRGGDASEGAFVGPPSGGPRPGSSWKGWICKVLHHGMDDNSRLEDQFYLHIIQGEGEVVCSQLWYPG